MKIKVFHRACGREALVQQILDSGGHCPWDGEAFNPHYTALLAKALHAAEEWGTRLESALDQIADMKPELTLEEGSLLAPLRDQLDRLDRHSYVPRR